MSYLISYFFSDSQSFLPEFEDTPVPKTLLFFSLPALEITSGGIQEGAGQYLKSIAKFEHIRTDIITRNVTFFDGHKATGVALLDRVFIKVKPYEWAGNAAKALNVIAIGTEIGSTWRQSNLTFGKKATKTGIIGLGTVITWGAGVATSGATLITSVAVAAATGVAVEYEKQQLYRKWKLE